MVIPRTRAIAGALRWRVENVKFGLSREVQFASQSFAQEGEDLILKRIFEGRPDGCYVDVGAHHPMRFSNTYLFYRAGWRGINIDATPGSMAPFQTARPRDINLEVGVSERSETLQYFIFDEPALNTFSAELAASRQAETNYKLVRTVEVRAEPLGEILMRHWERGRRIDFLSVDVEGWDLQVLRSNDWTRYSPEVVVAEALGTTLDDVGNSDVAVFMRSQGYALFAKTFNSVFFRRS